MIKTSIELQDNFSATIHRVIQSVSLSVSAMQELHNSVSTPVDVSAMDAIRDNLNQATIDAQALDRAFKQISTEHIAAPKLDNINWVSPNFEVFTNSGIDRFNQEISSANSLLDQLNQQQLKLSTTASQIDILPDNMISDITSVQLRIDGVRNKIIELEKIPLWQVDDSTNAQLETLRGKLAQMVSEQQALNNAVDNMDFESANRSCLQLSSILDGAERHLRDNMSGQDKFNKKIQEGQNLANKLTGLIKGAVGAYLGITGVKIALDLSDTMTSTKARLDLMNDGLQSTADLQNMIFLSAERSRGSYQDTADAVSKLGLMAGDAFSSSEEIIAFTEQLNKQFTIAGTDASGISAAMLQLTQAMGSGVLRGEEFNSILEQAPNIIESIATYMDVPKGALKDLAGEGKITADIVKNAMFATAEKTTDKFNSMPKTFSQIATSVQNTALMAFQPVLEKLNDVMNSDAFNIVIQNIINGLSTLANIATNAFNVLIAIGSFVADNWSIISPIIYGVVAAFAVYYGKILLVKGATLAMAAVNSVVAVAKGVLVAVTWVATSATWAQATAQHGLNAAILACPITWIILAIIALIAVVFMVANAIAKFTEIATNGFSLICGGINVVIQFFWNLFKTALNIGLGIGNVVLALGHNIQTAFGNSIANVQSFFYNLLSTALNVIGSIAEQLNKLPFISFDFSGITSQADEYASKAAELQANKGEYKSLTEAFSNGFNTFETFKDGWISDAFNSGAAWGDSVGDKISGLLDGFGGNSNIPNPDDYANLSSYGGAGNTDIGAGLNDIGNGLNDIGSGVKDTAGNTGAIKDSLEITEEDLKYLRDLAERDVINRFTTAAISVNLGGVTNNVNNGMDLDGIIDKIATGVTEAVEVAAEGVHV